MPTTGPGAAYAPITPAVPPLDPEVTPGPVVAGAPVPAEGVLAAAAGPALTAVAGEPAAADPVTAAAGLRAVAPEPATVDGALVIVGGVLGVRGVPVGGLVVEEAALGGCRG